MKELIRGVETFRGGGGRVGALIEITPPPAHAPLKASHLLPPSPCLFRCIELARVKELIRGVETFGGGGGGGAG